MTAKFGLLIDAKTKGENNIKRLGNSMQGVEGKAKNLGMAVRGVGAAFKGLFAIAAVGGIVALGKSAIDTADAFGKLSTRTGIAADKLLAYVNAGKLADVSQSDLETGLRTLARTQVEASEGVATYADAYAKLGVAVKNQDGTLKDSDQLLSDIADRFQDLPNGPEKAAVAMDIFGRSGQKMITLLNGGSEALDEFGFELSENFARNSETFNDNLTKVGIEMDRLKMQILDDLLPGLIELSQGFIDLTKTIRDGADAFAKFFGIGDDAMIAKNTLQIQGINKALAHYRKTLKDMRAETTPSFTRQGVIDEIERTVAGLVKRRDQLRSDINRATTPTSVDLTEDDQPLSGFLPTPDRSKPEKDTTGKTTLDALGIGLGRTGKVMEMLAALKEERRLLDATLEGKREEVELDIQVENLTKGLTPELAAHVEEIVRGNAGIQDRIKQQEELNNKTDKYKITLDQVKDTLANQMTSAIEGLIDGTKSLGESLSGLLRTFASMFLRSGVGSLVDLIPSAKGNVFAQNGIVPYAKGGYIGRPTMALMGEAGPEAVLPLRRGRGGRLGVETSGGGVGNVTVNVDASGSVVEGDGAQASQLGKAIGVAVQQELVKQKRPGGLLAS
jgi:hypothetical protein